MSQLQLTEFRKLQYKDGKHLPDRDTIPGRDRIIRILFRATVVLFKELCPDLMRYEKASS